MANESPENINFLASLNEFWSAEFPKICSKCGLSYENFSSLVSRTTSVPNGSGLVEIAGEKLKEVGLFRNCACGSTLMIHGSDRRDTSESGENRRQVFGAVLDKLIAANIPPDQARRRLLRVFYSGQLDDMAKRLLG